MGGGYIRCTVVPQAIWIIFPTHPQACEQFIVVIRPLEGYSTGSRVVHELVTG